MKASHKRDRLRWSFLREIIKSRYVWCVIGTSFVIIKDISDGMLDLGNRLETVKN